MPACPDALWWRSRIASLPPTRGPYVPLAVAAAGMAASTSAAAMVRAAWAVLASLTQGWTAEYSPRGVRVKAVAPGPIYTRPEARQLFDSLGATTALNR